MGRGGLSRDLFSFSASIPNHRPTREAGNGREIRLTSTERGGGGGFIILGRRAVRSRATVLETH